MAGGNIYEGLNIIDYYDVDDFIYGTNLCCEKLKSISNDYNILIFGSYEFVMNIMLELVNRYGYHITGMNVDEDIDTTYVLEINEYGLYAEDAYYFGDNGKSGIKLFYLGHDESMCFLHQDFVTQDLVDYCLSNCKNTTLFGIGVEWM